MRGDAERIRREVTAWAGVEAHAHRFGGTEYQYCCKEMGQVHGDRLVDLPCREGFATS